MTWDDDDDFWREIDNPADLARFKAAVAAERRRIDLILAAGFLASVGLIAVAAAGTVALN